MKRTKLASRIRDTRQATVRANERVVREAYHTKRDEGCTERYGFS